MRLREKALLSADRRMENSSRYLSGRGTDLKAVIRIFESGNSGPGVIVKASPCDSSEERALAYEFRALTLLQSLPAEDHQLRFSAPIPVKSFEQGRWHYTMETAAPGQPLSELIFLRSRRSLLQFLRSELSQCVAIAASMPDRLKSLIAPYKIDARWYQIPDGLRLGPRGEEILAAEAEKCRREELCAHGDFTIENVFWDSSTQAASAIDWEHPIQGVPRLYDAFTLLFSSVPALALEHREIPSDEDRSQRQFQAAFFGTGPWATATREILQRISFSLSRSAAEVWREMLISLVIRTNYLEWRRPTQGRQYLRLLECAAQHESSFLGGAFGAWSRAECSPDNPAFSLSPR